jgi:hypothetical protein
MPSCEVSLPSFSRRVAFSELSRQLFSVWLRLLPEMAIPAWAVWQCDGGHGAAAECVQLLRPAVAQCHYVFGARPQDTSQSFWLSWSQCGRTISIKLSDFGHSDNLWGGRPLRGCGAFEGRIPTRCRTTRLGRSCDSTLWRKGCCCNDSTNSVKSCIRKPPPSCSSACPSGLGTPAPKLACRMSHVQSRFFPAELASARKMRHYSVTLSSTLTPGYIGLHR